MENIFIEATESTPEVRFDYGKGELVLKGESYPENVTKFYGPVFDSLKSYLESSDADTVNFSFELIYFNSSSVKVIMNLFDMLEEAAEEGKSVNILWYYHEDDETIEEFGEEFSEDLECANFEMKAISE